MSSDQKRQLLRPELLAAFALAALCIGVSSFDLSAFDEAWIRKTAQGLGAFGPLALMTLMVLAIVISPIPSGPIAVAAGALYGSFEGAVVSIVGAEMGALLAFSLARHLGYNAVRRSDSAIMKWIAVPRSQQALMGIVFASRLIPFISFDAVSYAAGVTNLTFGRFALSTALGIVPICWALAAMGAGMATGGMHWMPTVAVAVGVTLIPVLVAWMRKRR